MTIEVKMGDKGIESRMSKMVTKDQILQSIKETLAYLKASKNPLFVTAFIEPGTSFAQAIRLYGDEAAGLVTDLRTNEKLKEILIVVGPGLLARSFEMLQSVFGMNGLKRFNNVEARDAYIEKQSGSSTVKNGSILD